MKKKVVIISGFQPINNPRAVKEAELLAANGYNVEILGSIMDQNSKSLIVQLQEGKGWKHVPVCDATDKRLLARVRHFYYHAARKFSTSLYTQFGILLPSQLGAYTRPLLRLAKRRRADLYIVHLEMGLWVGYKLLQQGHKVAADFEDWYSEDGLPADRKQRPIALMKRYERYLLNHCCYTLTTSAALANGLAREYECKQPQILFNSFNHGDLASTDNQLRDRQDSKLPSLFWFSQTVGPGRGLEVLFAALSYIDIPFEIHIRGRITSQAFKDQLLDLSYSPHTDLIYFHDLVPQAALLSRLVEHDIGFSGELSDCKSRDNTITNKAMEYVRAGLLIVASDTKGHLELSRKKGLSLAIYRQDDPKDLAAKLSSLVTQVKQRIDSKEVYRLSQPYRKENVDAYSWEENSQIILANVSRVLS